MTDTTPAQSTLFDVMRADEHLTLDTEYGISYMSDSVGCYLTASASPQWGAMVVGTYNADPDSAIRTVALDPDQAAHLAALLLEFVEASK